MSCNRAWKRAEVEISDFEIDEGSNSGTMTATIDKVID